MHKGWNILKLLFWIGTWGIITIFFAEVTGLMISHASYIAIVFTFLTYLISDSWFE